MNHTKEPWATPTHRYMAGMGECFVVPDEKKELIFIAEEENARRIVACVNALEGIPTDELEKAGTGMMSDAAVMVGKLTTQRNELLAALKGLVTGKGFSFECSCTADCEEDLTDMVDETNALWDRARDAISLIEADK